MSLLNLIPAPAKAGIAIAVVLAVGSFYLVHRAEIYRDGWDDAAEQFREELEVQKAANELAMKKRGEAYVVLVDNLILEKEALDAEVLKLTHEADADPAANDGGIGPDSVQRLNRIR